LRVLERVSDGQRQELDRTIAQKFPGGLLRVEFGMGSELLFELRGVLVVLLER